jgi:hypothetical protein
MISDFSINKSKAHVGHLKDDTVGYREQTSIIFEEDLWGGSKFVERSSHR